MPFYPAEITNFIAAALDRVRLADPDATGRAASFECGSGLKFEVGMTGDQISAISFTANGCGYMIACAEALAQLVEGQKLADLHGLQPNELLATIETRTGEMPEGRRHCFQVVNEALHAAFQDLRSNRIAEFVGEAALICTCFGISATTIEKEIAERSLATLDEVVEACRAGSGCGSCRILIQEILDDRHAGY